MLIRIYVKEVLFLMYQGYVKVFCYIIGGGLMENFLRVLLGNLQVQIDVGLWFIFLMFGWLVYKVRII